MEQPMYIDLNDPDSLHRMGINPHGKIYMLVHGYIESGDIPWLHEMAKALMHQCEEGECAAIIIDWGGGASPPYVQAVANIRLVGAITAHVVHMLYEELRLPNLDKVHITGHSLGAHLSGYAGYHLQRDFGLKLGRITGLDPAAPLFTDTDPIVRLDRTDAQFVDIIHSDANPLMKGGLGIIQRLGHVDFYPNGGFDNPGCNKKLQDVIKNNQKTTLFYTMQEFISCNHIRSEQYFIESIEGKCPFLGITCESYEVSALRDRCALSQANPLLLRCRVSRTPSAAAATSPDAYACAWVCTATRIMWNSRHVACSSHRIRRRFSI